MDPMGNDPKLIIQQLTAVASLARGSEPPHRHAAVAVKGQKAGDREGAVGDDMA